MKKLTNEIVSNIVNNYPTKFIQGFTNVEINSILEEYEINKDKFYDILGVNTCLMMEGQFVTYHCDIETALVCILQDREKLEEEWD